MGKVLATQHEYTSSELQLHVKSWTQQLVSAIPSKEKSGDRRILGFREQSV